MQEDGQYWSTSKVADPSWQATLHLQVLAAFSLHVGTQQTQWDTGVQMNAGLVARSETHRDTTHLGVVCCNLGVTP